MVDMVAAISGGNMLAALFVTAVISLILGMGLPTTANYIVVSSLMAIVIVELGAQTGLIVPLIAVHLFVFYFGIMADITPPVGLASFAAAAISGGDPIKTGLTSFFYSLRTAALPFLFIYNTDLLLIDVDWITGIGTFVDRHHRDAAVRGGDAGLLPGAQPDATNRSLLLLVAFTLFRPGFWMDMIVAAVPRRAARAGSRRDRQGRPGRGPAPADRRRGRVRQSEDRSSFRSPCRRGHGRHRSAWKRSASSCWHKDGELIVDDVTFGSVRAEGRPEVRPEDPESAHIDAKQPPKQLMWPVGFVVLALVVLLQRRRSAIRRAPLRAA